MRQLRLDEKRRKKEEKEATGQKYNGPPKHRAAIINGDVFLDHSVQPYSLFEAFSSFSREMSLQYRSTHYAA